MAVLARVLEGALVDEVGRQRSRRIERTERVLDERQLTDATTNSLAADSPHVL